MKKTLTDNSLLSLEKKLDVYSTDEIIINKFTLKPQIEKIDFSDSILNKNFVDFRSRTEEFLKDLQTNPEVKEKMNIEERDRDANKNKETKFIKMNLALGVLEPKQEKNNKLERKKG